MNNSGGVLWGGGGGPDSAVEDCPSIIALLKTTSAKVNKVTIWGRICMG